MIPLISNHTHHNDKPEPLNRHHNHPGSHPRYPMWFNAYYSRYIVNNERIFNMFSCLRGSSSCRNTASNRHDSWTWWNAIRRVAICAGYKIMLLCNHDNEIVSWWTFGGNDKDSKPNAVRNEQEMLSTGYINQKGMNIVYQHIVSNTWTRMRNQSSGFIVFICIHAIRLSLSWFSARYPCLLSASRCRTPCASIRRVHQSCKHAYNESITYSAMIMNPLTHYI